MIKKLTLTEFYHTMNPDLTYQEAVQSVNDMKQQDYHYGDCTNENISCRMCEFFDLVYGYDLHCDFYKQEHGKPMICYEY